MVMSWRNVCALCLLVAAATTKEVSMPPVSEIVSPSADALTMLDETAAGYPLTVLCALDCVLRCNVLAGTQRRQGATRRLGDEQGARNLDLHLLKLCGSRSNGLRPRTEAVTLWPEASLSPVLSGVLATSLQMLSSQSQTRLTGEWIVVEKFPQLIVLLQELRHRVGK